MLTIFALPKPFTGHIDIIQRNAIKSWKMLHPHCEIILFGDEEGTADCAREFDLLHIPVIARNEFGTPVVNDLFEKAQSLASHNILCYVNSDIILFSDIIDETVRIRQWKNYFLITGICWDLDIHTSLDFEHDGWKNDLLKLVKEKGINRGIWAIDYFIFPRYFYHEIPPFALGRAYFDNWFIWKALNQKAPVVNVSQTSCVIHQRHDYAHVAGRQVEVYQGKEAIKNIELAGGLSRRYCILDSTHYSSISGINKSGILIFNKIFLKIFLNRLWYKFLDVTRYYRNLVGLRANRL